jgi:hypothetical protein
MSIHKNYKKLTWKERNLVDDVMRIFFSSAKIYNIPLHGGDPAEEAVEALATFIVKSDPNGHARVEREDDEEEQSSKIEH